jgi:heavy metal translocating P-type ATPase
MDHQISHKYKNIVILSIAPIIIAVLILASFVLSYWHDVKIVIVISSTLAITATIFGGFQRFIAGFKDIYHRKITVNVFVVVALIATLAIGEFTPAAIIVFIMAVSGAFESYAIDRTKKSIRDLLDFAPKIAIIKKNNEEINTPISNVQKDDIVIIKPGARIPVDGIVLFGESSVNQAPITGESMPVEKIIGSAVFGGTLNESGYLEIRTEKVGQETTLAKIVHLVQEAQNTRAPIQNLADRFTTWFLPTVIILAAIAFFLSGSIKVAVSVLLVACPCAFAIATPTAVTAGISNLARKAVLVKGGIFLELGHKIDHLLIDKTGTFTFGKAKLMQIITFNNKSEEDVLQLACIAEKYSEHPLAHTILIAGKKHELTIPDAKQFLSTAGMGVEALWNEIKIRVGKISFLKEAGISLDQSIENIIAKQSEQGRTSVLIASDNQVIGLIAIADEVRPETKDAIRQLKAMGIKQITMLTGDNLQVAKAIAQELGVDFQAELLPKQKQDIVRALQAKGHVVGMIGDGINDAPALALADVGVAMGTDGSDVAIETADVTLMNDRLSGVVDFMWMSRKVLTRIKLNIFFSMIYNVIGLTLGVLGYMTPIIAILFQEAGCITVVLSSTLLLWIKQPERPASHA